MTQPAAEPLGPLVPHAKARVATIGGHPCGFIERAVWAKGKQTPMPWAFVAGYQPLDPSLHLPKVPIRFFACRASDNCGQVWEVPAKGVREIQSNMIRHVEKHFTGISTLVNGEGKEQVKKSPYEFVSHWLASGMPHYQVTRNSPSGLYRYLGSVDCPVSSQATFKKHMNTFLDNTVANMQGALANHVGFIMGDSSPDRLKREWISWGVSFIDTATLKFHYMPLGVNQAVGRLTAEAYGNHHEQLVAAWGMSTKTEMGSGPIFSRGGLKGFVIVGGGCDCGPGLRQVYQKSFGAPDVESRYPEATKLVMFGPCASHAIANIYSLTRDSLVQRARKLSILPSCW